MKLYEPKNSVMRVAAFMSGSGTNVRELIKHQKGYEITLIVTETMSTKCKAREISKEYHIPLIERDMKEYYKERNVSRKDMDVRREFDSETAHELQKNGIDVVALCGYNSIITEPVILQYLTVNVHPADLRVKEKGTRVYAGCMGTNCIQTAIDHGENQVHSTTHVVTAGVDEGQILMVSQAVDIATTNENTLHQLKKHGDWVIYPKTLEYLAQGKYSLEHDEVYFDGKPIPEGVVL